MSEPIKPAPWKCPQCHVSPSSYGDVRNIVVFTPLPPGTTIETKMSTWLGKPLVVRAELDTSADVAGQCWGEPRNDAEGGEG